MGGGGLHLGEGEIISLHVNILELIIGSDGS